jgi:RNA polymerase sigma-70 factor, ECF subfamily
LEKAIVITLTDLYKEFERKLRRYAIHLTHDAHKADDLVQETFIRSMRHFMLLEQLDDCQRQAWLYRTLKNLVLDEQYARQREQVLVEQLAQQARLLQDIQIDSHPMLEMLTKDVFDQIPPRYRELLYKHFVLGLNSQEIACELGIPATTVRSRIHLALKKLRAKGTHFL